MSFETSAYLRKATSRAKSDVANKLVSMLLHDLSRKISAAQGASVTDPVYADSVAKTFGDNCCYCGRPLENDRAAVEHLDGMNRFRVGLHIRGNVIIACKQCNGEKRRDDQLHTLTLAQSGWESYLSHNSDDCAKNCKTCVHWTKLWPDISLRIANLNEARRKISKFRSCYPESLQWGQKAAALLRPELDKLYRECQEFATDRIRKAVDEAFAELHRASDSLAKRP
jgi:hypothetical protein